MKKVGEIIRGFILGIIVLAVLIFGLVYGYRSVAYTDIPEIKERAPEYVKNMNMTIVSYEGYQGRIFKGGICWYLAEDSKGYLYEFGLCEWDGELHLYGMKCLNAVTNN